MRGILRPCKSHLPPALYERWQAHLCGLCLTLRDVAGQPERALTGYDVLLLSVLVEAQTGSLPTTEAGPCPLRAFKPATVMASDAPAARLAAAGALLSGGAGLVDKLDDGDLPRPARGPARHAATRLDARGTALAAEVGLDPTAVVTAPARAAAAEAHPQDGLAALLAPSGEAVATLFAHTATVAGRPGNAHALARAGAAFGALVHLLDAVEDHADDAHAGRFNPLTATATPAEEAHRLARLLTDQVAAALDEVELVDPELVDLLLRRELANAVGRAFPGTGHACTAAAVPAQRGSSVGVLAAGLALWAAFTSAVFVGGTAGSCGGPPRRRGGYSGGGHAPYGHGRRRSPYGYPPHDDPRNYPTYGGYPPPGFGYPQRTRYRSVGPSCGQLLACNCAANLCCNACCCGQSCANG